MIISYITMISVTDAAVFVALFVIATYMHMMSRKLHVLQNMLNEHITKIFVLELQNRRIEMIINPSVPSVETNDESDAEEDKSEAKETKIDVDWFPSTKKTCTWAPVEHEDASSSSTTRVGRLVLEGDKVIEDEWSSSKSGGEFRRMMKSHWEKLDAENGKPAWLVEQEENMTAEERADWNERVLVSAK